MLRTVGLYWHIKESFLKVQKGVDGQTINNIFISAADCRPAEKYSIDAGYEDCLLYTSSAKAAALQGSRPGSKPVSYTHLPDIADVLIQLDKPSRVLLFRCLPRKTAADVFSELEGEDTDSLLKELTDEETRLLLAYMRPDDRTELLEELPGQVTQRMLNLLSPDDMKEARSLLGYPERSIGRLMTCLLYTSRCV